MGKKFKFVLNRIIGDQDDFGIVDKEKKSKKKMIGNGDEEVKK